MRAILIDELEYALNAVNQGVTSLGIKAANGIVLATEKKSSTPLIDASSSRKIELVTPNIGMVYSGMGPDYRVLVDKARKVSHTGYKRIYNEYPPTRILVQDVARVMQEATQSGGVRPYGVSLLIAGYDEGVEPTQQEEGKKEGAEGMEVDEEQKVKKTGKTGGILKGGPSLYQVDPSGSYFPVEGDGDWEECDEREDVPGEAVYGGFGAGGCGAHCAADAEGDD